MKKPCTPLIVRQFQDSTVLDPRNHPWINNVYVAVCLFLRWFSLNPVKFNLLFFVYTSEDVTNLGKYVRMKSESPGIVRVYRPKYKWADLYEVECFPSWMFLDIASIPHALRIMLSLNSYYFQEPPTTSIIYINF